MELPVIVVTLGSKVIEKRKLDQDVVTIGRAPESDIVINNLAVSRHHATIYKKDSRLFIKDLASANGTFVNGVKVNEAEFSNGDVILIGKHVIKFHHEDSRSEEGTALRDDDGGTVVVDAKTQEKFLKKLKNDLLSKAPRLVLSDGKQVEIKNDPFTIGKGYNSNLEIDGFFVRNPHAKIVKLSDATYRIVNMGSFFTSTTVNGVKIREKVLQNGDMIKIGKHAMTFTI